MNKTKCCTRQELNDLLGSDGEAIAPGLEQHLEACPACRNELERLAGEVDWWSTVSSHLSATDNLARSTTGLGEMSGELSSRNDFRQLLAPPAHPEMLGRIGRYDVESMIGQGGFGVVFKAFDTELNRPVAIKVLASHLSTSGVARRRFAREAQAAAAVNHPNVVPIHAVDAQAAAPYLVMTFIPGHSLQAIVARFGPLDAKSVVRMGQQIAAGLAAAHRQGLVHRDIKPANILLENDLSRAMITDFGLARAADDAAATQTGWLAGTPLYMSPEQARGQDLDARSDLFSLGSVLYFLATGREPFRGDSPLSVLRKINEHQPLPAHHINNEVPRELSQIIARLLEKNPADRFTSASELEVYLEQYLAHLQQPQSCARPRLGLSRRSKRRLWWTAWATSACSSVLAGIWAWQQTASLTPSRPDEPSLTWSASLNALQGDRLFENTLQALASDLTQLEQSHKFPSAAWNVPEEDWVQQEINRTKSILDRFENRFFSEEPKP